MKIELEITADEKRIIMYIKNTILFVDYDDVDHKKVKKDLKKIIRILEDNWDK